MGKLLSIKRCWAESDLPWLRFDMKETLAKQMNKAIFAILNANRNESKDQPSCHPNQLPSNLDNLSDFF